MRESDTARWAELSTEEVLARLDTGVNGLSSTEAAWRQARWGPNELAAEAGPSPLQILLGQVQNPLIYLLLAAGVLTVIVGSFVDAAVIAVVVAVDLIVGFVQEFTAEQALCALARLTAPRARALRDGVEREIDPRELVPGDVVILESGFRVPADLRLLRTVELQIDESLLTGESLPVAKRADQTPRSAQPPGAVSLAFMGTGVVRGRGDGVVVATGMRTALGGISGDVREIGEVEAPLLTRLGALANLIAVGAVGVTALVFVLGVLRGENLAEVFLTAVATAVAAVPEGLQITVTIALAAGVWRMAQRHAIVRKLPAVETLGSCTLICSDKTGTLTTNQMTVTRLFVDGSLYHLTGVGYAPIGTITDDGRPTPLVERSALRLALRIGLLCNGSDVYQENGRWCVDGDPTEGALIVAAMKGGLQPEAERIAFPTLDEIPFASDRQYMATLHRSDATKLVFLKGAPERVVEMCEWVAAGGKAVAFDRSAARAIFHELATEGLRVLGLAYRPAPAGLTRLEPRDLERGLIFVGFVGMIDPPRPEAAPAVADCRRAGVRVTMITGDHPATARVIAVQLGIARVPDAPVVEGRQLAAMSDDEIFAIVGEVNVYARVTPKQKLRIVQQARRRGQVVAVTGDGVNDAPALKQADIGVAMGIAGTEVAKEAADMVLADDNFATIYAAVEEGRAIFDNIRKVIMFLLPTGLGLVATVIASLSLALPLPFLPAQAIWINLVTNGTQDIAMAFEPAETDVGRRPPRDPREGLLTSLLIQRTVLVGVVIAVGTVLVYAGQIARGDGVAHARTVAMTTMVLFQNFHIFNSRSLTRSIFQLNPFSNRFLFWSIVGALGLQLVALSWEPLRIVLHRGQGTAGELGGAVVWTSKT